jgi:transposase-like protein
MKQRKQYTKEFKQGAARLVTEQGRTISDAATSLSIPAWSLSRWVKTLSGATAIALFRSRRSSTRDNASSG